MDESGTIWLTLWEPHVRFVLPRQPQEKERALAQLLERSQGGSFVKVRYDGSAGRVNAGAATLDYPLCAFTVDDIGFEPAAPCATEETAPPSPSPEAALARAQAHANAGNFALAADLLRPLSFSDPAPLRLLLRVRAQTNASLAELEERLSPASDSKLAAALSDLRELGKLQPDDVEVQLETAQILQQLGGYDEARALYGRILARWSDETYRVAIRLGALHRAQGNYDKALDELNALAGKGPQEGMRYHYHRGWTLSLLGRFDEAVAEYSKGLASQPDYDSAYLRRACARAAVGDVAAALADAEAALNIVARLPDGRTSALAQKQRSALEEVRTRLQAAVASGSDKPVERLCGGDYWERWERPRPRSPLLSRG